MTQHEKFFEEMALKKYENCIIIGDFHVDMNKPDSQASAQLNSFFDTFDLANIFNEILVSLKTTHQGLT